MYIVKTICQKKIVKLYNHALTYITRKISQSLPAISKENQIRQDQKTSISAFA